jgi:Rieske Fe-S protein
MDSDCDACMDRRNFILLSLAAATAAGCVGPSGSSTTGALHSIDAGPVANYAKDGVYPQYRDLGFFIVRRGAKLEVLSSICTHRNCKLTAEPDHTFYCDCHGSTFDPDGRVTLGPATRNLPLLTASTSASGHLIVQVPG